MEISKWSSSQPQYTMNEKISLRQSTARTRSKQFTYCSTEKQLIYWSERKKNHQAPIPLSLSTLRKVRAGAWAKESMRERERKRGSAREISTSAEQALGGEIERDAERGRYKGKRQERKRQGEDRDLRGYPHIRLWGNWPVTIRQQQGRFLSVSSL